MEVLVRNVWQIRSSRLRRQRETKIERNQLWPEWEYSHRLCVWMLGPQLVVLFGRLMEALGGGALLKEAHHWLHFLFPLSLLPASWLLGWAPVPAAMPPHHDGHQPSETASQNKPFLPYIALTGEFLYSKRKGTNTPAKSSSSWKRLVPKCWEIVCLWPWVCLRVCEWWSQWRLMEREKDQGETGKRGSRDWWRCVGQAASTT